MKVVIADDEPLARERLRALLAEHPGIDVVAEAENGLDALQACSQHRPDMVLLDIAMPGVDGLEAARHLAAFDPRPRLPIAAPCVILRGARGDYNANRRLIQSPRSRISSAHTWCAIG